MSKRAPRTIIFLIALCAAFVFFAPRIINAAGTSNATGTITVDQITFVKAKVMSVTDKGEQTIPGTDTKTKTQTITAEPLEGPDKGVEVTFDNDYPNQFKQGDIFYLRKTVFAEDGRTFYSVSDAYRLNALWFFVALFIVLVIVFGGKQGVRGLLSLIGSLALVVFVLLPGILHGISPIFLSLGVASLIIILGSYITHGFNKTTTSAVIGMISTIILVGILAHFAVEFTQLTGFETEESVYLNFNTRGSIDLAGLLLGGILIGILGIMYDAAISQAIAVEELHNVAPHLSRLTIYRRAIRMGREHIGALVNTLAIAYVGVSLPLLLLFSTNDTPFWQVLNREIFATEIIRTMVGSIGLILAVPVTTLLATFILIKKTGAADAKTIQHEREELEHFQHHH